MIQIFFRKYILWQWLHSCVFHANLLTSSFAEEVKGARGGGERDGIVWNWAFSQSNSMYCWFYSSFYTWLYAMCFVCKCVLFSLYSILFYPFFHAATKSYSSQSLLILMCAWKAHFLFMNMKGTPRRRRGRSPPLLPPLKKLFVVFIVV